MKRVLFVCVENSCRSQMAESLANFYGKWRVEAFSAGSKPSGMVNPNAITVMKELGLDIASNTSKSFNDLKIKEFDYVITLGCSDVCPFFPAKEYIDWKIADPKGKDIDFFRKVRDDIKKQIKEFLKKLKS